MKNLGFFIEPCLVPLPSSSYGDCVTVGGGPTPWSTTHSADVGTSQVSPVEQVAMYETETEVPHLEMSAMYQNFPATAP